MKDETALQMVLRDHIKSLRKENRKIKKRKNFHYRPFLIAQSYVIEREIGMLSAYIKLA
jgi:hypothetical protein